MQPQFQPPPPPPPPAPPTSGPLELTFGAHGFTLVVARREFVKRGLRWLFAMPVGFAAILLLFLIMIGNQFDGDPPFFVFGVIWGVLSTCTAIWGLILLLTVGSSHEKSKLSFDAQRWSLTRQGREEPLQKFSHVRVRRPSQLIQFWALELVPHGTEKPLTLYGRFLPKQGAVLAQSASWLAYMLRLPADIDANLSTLDSRGMNEKTAAMFCYMPIQGLFLGMSLYYVFKGDRRPLVRFAARQSLIQTAFSFLVLIFICALFGVPVALLDDGVIRVVMIVLLAVFLGAFVIWNLTAHIVACVRASRGVAWTMPWLTPVVSRWHPSSERT